MNMLLTEKTSSRLRANARPADWHSRKSAESGPQIETSDYTYDRVKHIEIKEEIPDNFAAVAKSEAWAQMIRTQAFEQLLNEVGPAMNLKVECAIWEKSETDTTGRNRNYVLCQLRYTTD